MNQLTLIHRQSHEDLSESHPAALVWKTCLRQVGFLAPEDVPQELAPGDELLEGADASAFLLEVICGLHSPILAETEIQGQYKRFIEDLDQFDHCERGYLKQVGQSLLKHAKAIRSHYLMGMGSRSYGGLVRQYCKGLNHISILGAGQLAQQMLPLLRKSGTVDIVARNVAKAKQEITKTDCTEFFSFGDALPVSTSEKSALVIAAPIPATTVLQWLKSQDRKFSMILDLRKESVEDSLTLLEDFSIPVISLQKLFEEAEEHEDVLEMRIEKAKREIASRAKSAVTRETCRPFGWEDLCA